MRFVGPLLPSDAKDRPLLRSLYDAFRDIAGHLKGLSEGRIGSLDAYTAAPTTGAWQAGDFVRNSAPVEAGTAGSKYVIVGWVCVADGTPGTWVQSRTMTGN